MPAFREWILFFRPNLSRALFQVKRGEFSPYQCYAWELSQIQSLRRWQEKETVNKSQIYVTRAGWKNSFAYEKLIQLLIQSIIDPSEAIVMGGSWRVPVMEKLLKKSFIEELKLDGTYNDSSFAREYESEWSGDAENAYFSAEKFDRHR